ncbi:MAG: cytochrome c oxidase subunit II [Chloroflexi bacterium]|nr:cytochrome c oxidase subunit II [Chloroflexota bacterium]
MNRSRLTNIALIVVLVFAVLVAATQFISASRQVTNPAASTLDVSNKEEINFLGLFDIPQTSLFVALSVFTLASLVGMGVGLTLLFRFLNQEVREVAEEPDHPVNPLSYDTYGHRAAAGVIGGLFLLTAGMLLGGGVLPVKASAEADKVDFLFQIEFFFIAIFFALVAGLFIHFLIYFRARPGDDSDGVFVHGNLRLELLWTIGPAIIVTALGIFAAITLFDIQEANAGEVPIEVTGQQWVWQFNYPLETIPEELHPENEEFEGFSSAELVLLVDQPVVFEMTAVDVIHSFWIPEMRIKRDVAPGVITELRLTPSQPGEYRMLCNQLCGTRHGAMIANVRVLNENDYAEWISQQLARFANPVTAGESIYETNCVSCHSLDGSRPVGPTWQGLYGSERELTNGETIIADEQYIINSIINPNDHVTAADPPFRENVMPQDFGERFDEVELTQIVAFVKAQSDEGCQELAESGALPEEGDYCVGFENAAE